MIQAPDLPQWAAFLVGLLVLIVGVAILVDRLKNRRPKEPSESDIIDAL